MWQLQANQVFTANSGQRTYVGGANGSIRLLRCHFLERARVFRASVARLLLSGTRFATISIWVTLVGRGVDYVARKVVGRIRTVQEVVVVSVEPSCAVATLEWRAECHQVVLVIIVITTTCPESRISTVAVVHTSEHVREMNALLFSTSCVWFHIESVHEIQQKEIIVSSCPTFYWSWRTAWMIASRKLSVETPTWCG